jgi:DNA-binding response OmpR family regulator
MTTLLYVEDDNAIAKGVIRGLEAQGFSPVWARSAEEGAEVLARTRVDLILLDVRLPRKDGFTFCRDIRSQGVTVPIIMLTARDEEVDRVMGLEIGADDYLVKPFSLRELVARIRSQLRRAYGELSGSGTGNIVLGHLRIDVDSLRVFSGETEVYLTPIELRILRALAENAGTTLTREILIDRVWGDGYALEDVRTVDVHVRHLREKIEKDPSRPTLIQTVRGYGYRCVKES